MCLPSGSCLPEGHIHLHFSYSVLSTFLLAAVSLMDSHLSSSSISVARLLQERESLLSLAIASHPCSVSCSVGIPVCCLLNCDGEFWSNWVVIAIDEVSLKAILLVVGTLGA